MPYFFDPNLDDENKNNASGFSISGASPTSDSTGAAQSNTAGKKGLNTGSGYQNLDKYLQTNQAKDFGGQVLGNVSSQVQNAGTQMNQAGEQFKNQVQSANQLPTEAQLNQSIAAPDKADKGQFKTWMTQSYSGPNNLADNQDTWNKYWSGVNQAQANTKLLGNEAGRFTLLDQFFGRPQYNFGEKSLDNLLVQQSGLGNQTQALKDQATQLKVQGKTGADELQGLASTRAGEVEQNRNNVRNTIGVDAQGQVITGDNAGVLGKQYQQINDEVAQTNAERKAQQDYLTKSLASGSLTPDQMLALGLDPGQKLYNTDLSKYYTAGKDLDVNQVMTPEQRSYLQALSDLAGHPDDFAFGLSESPTEAYKYDSKGLKQDVAGAEGAYNRALTETMVTPPNLGGIQERPGGKLQPISLGDLEQRIANVRNMLASGQDVAGGQSFVDQGTAYLNQVRSQIADQYQINRTLGETKLSTPNTKPTVFGRLPGGA